MCTKFRDNWCNIFKILASKSGVPREVPGSINISNSKYTLWTTCHTPFVQTILKYKHVKNIAQRLGSILPVLCYIINLVLRQIYRTLLYNCSKICRLVPLSKYRVWWEVPGTVGISKSRYDILTTVDIAILCEHFTKMAGWLQTDEQQT